MAVPVSGEPANLAHRAEQIEFDLLLDALYQLYGFDFRGYERTAIRGKFFDFMRERELKTLSSLQDVVMHDAAVADALLLSLASRETSMFENPAAYRRLREIAGALLRSYPLSRVWLAECTSPEEIFSLAILLEEIGVLEKTDIYVTCSNPELLQRAREGRFDLERLSHSEANYLEGGGTTSFSQYWSRQGDQGVFLPELVRNVTWAQYNLVTDTTFNEFQMIICRHQLAGFGVELRRRVLALLSDSLVQFGLLHTDRVDDLASAPFSINYKPLFSEHSIYQRT